MNLLRRVLRRPQKNTASVAKERLKIIVAHERVTNTGPDFLPQLRQELVAVIAKYVDIDLDQVKVDLEQDGNNTVLELNITIPEQPTLAAVEAQE